MKLVIQRVNSSSVSVREIGKTVGSIKKGLLVLLGIRKGDSKRDADYLAEKLVKLRIMSDKSRKMNLSVKDSKAKILLVSQFTLYADTGGGNRPSFIKAAEPDLAKELYFYFIDCIKKSGVDIETGSFGSYMKIKSELDGPVTIILESP